MMFERNDEEMEMSVEGIYKTWFLEIVYMKQYEQLEITIKTKKIEKISKMLTTEQMSCNWMRAHWNWYKMCEMPRNNHSPSKGMSLDILRKLNEVAFWGKKQR